MLNCPYSQEKIYMMKELKFLPIVLNQNYIFLIFSQIIKISYPIKNFYSFSLLKFLFFNDIKIFY